MVADLDSTAVDLDLRMQDRRLAMVAEDFTAAERSMAVEDFTEVEVSADTWAVVVVTDKRKTPSLGNSPRITRITRICWADSSRGRLLDNWTFKAPPVI